ncbi:MAG TPA: hypothetical protein EYN90_02420 [Acidobacteria bacterium]|jgi:lactate dehydrogenase-like 2-hydroxyacid dehydrogenase|nr:hypothetical protein [Acidobacteriota bacterium]HIN70874.1 hypothetical protein [Acidobacteriota bacterium]
MDPPLIFLNYFVDPKRRSRHYQALLTDLGSTSYVVTDRLSPADAPRVRIIINKTRELSTEVLGEFPHLAGICLHTTDDWMATFDRDKSSIKIQAADTHRGTDVAEVATLLMLIGLKRLTERSRWHALRSPKRFYRQLTAPLASETIGGHNWTGASTLTAYRKRVGIVGYGLIGHQIHRRLEAFGAQVFYHHTRRFSHIIEERLGMQFLELPSMFRQCDIIFIQLPLTSTTQGLIGNQELALAKSNLVLVNCGRAAVINKRALFQALKKKRVAFYGADVFWREPMPLWDRFRFMRNVYVTPHFSESEAGREPHDRHVARALRTLVRAIDADL